MTDVFTIANFRHVAKGLQPGQFAVGDRRKASSLKDLARYHEFGAHRTGRTGDHDADVV